MIKQIGKFLLFLLLLGFIGFIIMKALGYWHPDVYQGETENHGSTLNFLQGYCSD